MKWYQEERLALWERLYALQDTSEFGEAVVERYTKWTMRRFQQGKMARHRYLRFVDAMKRCHEEQVRILELMKRVVAQEYKRIITQ